MDEQKIAESQSSDSEQSQKTLFMRMREGFYGIPVFWRAVGFAVLGVLIIGVVARWLPDMKDRMKFFADSSFSWLILVVVAIQAYIYTRQWRVMEKQTETSEAQIDAMRDAFYVGERAYMYLKNIFPQPFEMGKPIIVHIIYANGGRTPAREVHVTTEYHIRSPEYELKPHIQKAEYLKSSGWFVPARGEAPEILTCDEIVTESLIKEFKAGRRVLYVAGVCTYKDFSGELQTDSFEVRLKDYGGGNACFVNVVSDDSSRRVLVLTETGRKWLQERQRQNKKSKGENETPN